MRKTVLLALALSALTLSSVSAQISYVFSDLPVNGDLITRYRDTMTVYGPGPSGANQQWNFPSPVQHEVVTTSVIAPSSTPHASQFTSSNMAMTNDNSAYLFFSNSQSAMIATGTAGDLLQNGTNVTVPFSNTLKVHNLPRTYNDNFNDSYYFEAIANNIPIVILGIPTTVHSARLRHHGHVYDTTDGYGQITTPIGTYECLRVKKVDYTVDSVWTKLFSFSPWTYQSTLGGRDTITGYSWLAKETKLAVAELSFDSLGAPKVFTWSSIPPLATGITEAEDNGLRIYPQPASGSFTIQTTSGSDYRVAELHSMDGRKVRSMALQGRDRNEMGTEGLVPGLYMLRLLPSNGEEAVSRKVLVQ